MATVVMATLAGSPARAGDGGGGDGGSDAGAAFDALAREFLETTLRQHPEEATHLGDHRFDGQWTDPSSEARQWREAWLRSTRARLEQIPLDQLDPEQRVDAAMLAHHIDAELFAIDGLRPWENRPLRVVQQIGGGLDDLVTRDFAPREQRLDSLRRRLAAVPPLIDQACRDLQTPPRIHTETAIDQNRALIAYVDGPLRASFGDDPERRAALDAAADVAAAALRRFQDFLVDDLLPRSTEEFRLGPELFEDQLAASLDSALTADEVVAEAWALLDRTTVEMGELAAEVHAELWPGEPIPDHHDDDARAALIRKVLDRMAADHADDDTVVAEAQATLEEATAFVVAQGFVTLPDGEVHVIEMPEFKRGVAIAYCDAPGPLEEVRDTFYAIAPPPRDWPAERRESFYREYNRTMLHELTIHEAMPGHYLQLTHAASFDSPVRAVLGSGTFIEGWALYTEWLMQQHGYGGAPLGLQRLKMVLRLCINAILDHEVHAGSMTHDEAIALMTERGFQEVGEAEGKWVRAQLTAGQLSTYLVGLLEMMRLRRDAEAAAGDSFDERAYHDEILRHGSPTPRHLRALLGLAGAAGTGAGAAPR